MAVRRFLTNPSSTSTSTPSIKDRTSLSSSRSSSPTKELPPPPTPATKALFIRKDRKPPPSLVSGLESTTSSPTTSTPPQYRKPPPSEWQETPSPSPRHLGNGVQQANTRDAMLLSLLSSEAMVDSRSYEILSAEEVEELKKVRDI